MARILLYQKNGAETLQTYLSMYGYDTCIFNENSVFSALKSGRFDVWILDHFEDGKPLSLRLLNAARDLDANTPLLMVSEAHDIHSITEALDAGADDYMAKPCNMDEMVSRIKALLRRNELKARTIQGTYTLGKYTFDTMAHTLTATDGSVKIAPNQVSRFLAVMCAYANEDVPRDVLARAIWGNNTPSMASICTCVALARQLLDDEPNVRIVVIRNFGYRLIAPDEG